MLKNANNRAARFTLVTIFGIVIGFIAGANANEARRKAEASRLGETVPT